MLDKQKTFNTVLVHLLNQGWPARSGPHKSCHYRTPFGLMCAVGCLIPADAYDPLIEGRTARAPEVINLIPDADAFSDGDFLTAMQRVHDEAPARHHSFADAVGYGMRLVAENFQLEMPDVD